MTGSLENYQDEIYLTGNPPVLPADLSQLEELASRRMTSTAFGYIRGGAGTGDTVRENAEAFRRWRIVPSMLTDVSAVSYRSSVLGTELSFPLLLGPVGVLRLAHQDGELAVARVAGELGVPMVLSTAASCTMEEVAAACGSGPRWYQLYWPKDRSVAESLIGRAAAAGFSVLMVTLDTRLLGWRPVDLDAAYLPFLRGIGIQNYLSDPVFCAGLPEPLSSHQDQAVLRWAQMFGDPSLTWADLPWLRSVWDGPIVLKGIMSVADAVRAVDAGMDGIVVSNHGGRQVDGGLAALDALPGVAARVGSELTVLFDSGVRSGADVLKAVALGARAVLIGRPYAYGLGLAGEDGVRHVLRALRTDFEITMRLAGLASLSELDPDVLVRHRRRPGPG
ncbi:MAG TPA: alpha-hydroxy-acid oxidizing protein [Streptosporangiaceae bacterium]|nr:alpha-hydroxy-acid oxidizing protein [Streptosporangiaceae bacterium]